MGLKVYRKTWLQGYLLSLGLAFLADGVVTNERIQQQDHIM